MFFAVSQKLFFNKNTEQRPFIYIKIYTAIHLTKILVTFWKGYAAFFGESLHLIEVMFNKLKSCSVELYNVWNRPFIYEFNFKLKLYLKKN